MRTTIKRTELNPKIFFNMRLSDLRELVERTARIDDISEKSRKTHFVIARCAFYLLAKERTEASYRRIGEEVGRDHAGAYHGIHVTAPSYMTANDTRLHELLEDCRKVLNRKKIRKPKKGIPEVFQKEMDYLRNKASKADDPFIKQILELNPVQYGEFKERAKIMLKFVTSNKYGTQHRKDRLQGQE